MKLNIEQSTEIKALSGVLCVAALLLSAIPIGWVWVQVLGGEKPDYYYFTIYSTLPPKYFPQDSNIIPQAYSPIKDFIYALLMGSIFLFLGYFKIRMRWLFHFTAGVLGLFAFTMIVTKSFRGSGDPDFLLGKLFLCSISLLSIIVGMLIIRSNSLRRMKEKSDNKADLGNSASASSPNL